MSGSVEKKLAGLGITLPTPATPVANYVPFVRSGNLLVVSGQLCFEGEGKLVAVGKLGGSVSIETAPERGFALTARIPLAAIQQEEALP